MPPFYHTRLSLANRIERWSASLMYWLRNAGVPLEIRRDYIITPVLARQMALVRQAYRKVEERRVRDVPLDGPAAQ